MSFFGCFSMTSFLFEEHSDLGVEMEVERELIDQKPQGILSVHPVKSLVLYPDFLRN